MTTDMAGGADAETGGLVLVGNAKAFAWFTRFLRVGEVTTVDLKPLTGRPSIRAIARLQIGLASHVATIRVENDSATLIGNRESLTRLADEVDLFLEHNDLTEPGMHAHFNTASWSDGEALFGQTSRALTLAGPVPDSL